jgi:signal peptidase I
MTELVIGVLATAAVIVAVLAGLLLARRRIAIVSITGRSMEPALADGDRVLVRRTGLRSVHAGQIVVVEAPDFEHGGWTQAQSPGWLIKRAAAVPGDPLPNGLPALAGDLRVPENKLVVLSDNQQNSVDSRQLGYVPGDRVLGVVVRSLPRDLRVSTR